MAIQRLSYADISVLANEVFRKHNSQGIIPTPIEEIIDLGYRIDVIEADLLDKFQIDAYISRDLTEIRVDKRVYNQIPPNRFRFSLAHEFAHLILHHDIYRAMTFTSVQEWKQQMKDLANDDYDWLEWQANAFAGLILVPPQYLRQQVETIRQKFKDAGADPDRLSEPAMARVTRMLGQTFGVSDQVISIRLRKDSLWVPPE